MDPSPSELLAITSLDEACVWAGVTPELREALEGQCGQIAVVRELVLMEDAEFTVDLSNAMLVTAAATSSAVAVTRKLLTVERARLLSLRRVARLLCGLP